MQQIYDGNILEEKNGKYHIKSGHDLKMDDIFDRIKSAHDLLKEFSDKIVDERGEGHGK